ncbi:MAG: MBL fold metallo-hydrolase [Desulfobacteraceae bacterium]|nr:MBL fold metallo-hydrolase [Desulfobacteraceae bacterium]
MKICDGLYVFPWTSMSANNCNTYLIDGPARILIDPGHFHLFENVAVQLKALGIELSDIDLVLVTHGHPDHFEAVKHFKTQRSMFCVSLEDYRMIEEIGNHYGPAFDLDAYQPDFFLSEGNLDVKGVDLEVIQTPGHSPGSVSVYWGREKALFSGDVLFRDGLGRTDLPGGNGESLKKSIKGLESLDIELLLPGHGDVLQGSEAVKANFKKVQNFWFAYI